MAPLESCGARRSSRRVLPGVLPFLRIVSLPVTLPGRSLFVLVVDGNVFLLVIVLVDHALATRGPGLLPTVAVAFPVHTVAPAV